MQAVIEQIGVMVDRTSDDVAVGASRADRAMERYACGDDDAFVELYDDLAPRLYGFAFRWTRSRSAAEDAVQQTLLQMHAARDRFVAGSAVVPWAYAIARRLLIDLRRRHGREELRGEHVLDAEEPATATPPDDALHWRRVEADAWRELASLPAAWREAFELVKFEGLSVAEAADVLGVTGGMVKIRTHRATVALREAVARREDGAPTPSKLDAPSSHALVASPREELRHDAP